MNTTLLPGNGNYAYSLKSNGLIGIIIGYRVPNDPDDTTMVLIAPSDGSRFMEIPDDKIRVQSAGHTDRFNANYYAHELANGL